MFVEKIWCNNVTMVSGAINRKVVAVAMTKMLEASLSPLWPIVLTALVKLFELPAEQRPEDDDFVDLSQVCVNSSTPNFSLCAWGFNSPLKFECFAR